MRRPLVLLLGLTFACGKAAAPPAADAGAAGEAAEAAGGTSKAQIAVLDPELGEIGKAKDDAAKRRDLCIAFEPKVWALQDAHKNDTKVEQFAAKVSVFCGEAVEARKFMKKAAEPRPPVPELAAAMKSSFTASLLKDDFAKAQDLVKKKGDPTDVCKKIHMTATIVAEQKKKDKKTKKLLKSATAFCGAPALSSSIRFHLDAAEKALAEGKGGELADHCTTALVRWTELPDGKPKTTFDETLKTSCKEVYVHKDWLVKS